MHKALPASLLLFAAFFTSCAPPEPEAEAEAIAPTIMTVAGPIEPQELGFTLPHEHILVDFGGAATATPDRYDTDLVYHSVLPFLQNATEFGMKGFVDCTPAYLGRDVALLKRISTDLSIHILTPTGYYGAGQDRYLPPHAYSETADQLALRWIAEWENGIDGTEIRPGFIKTAFDRGLVSDVDAKLFRAGARAHLKTGLTLATHTGGNLQAIETQLQILAEEGVSPSAWIWVHAQNVANFEQLLPALKAGAWIGLEGLRRSSLQKHAFDKQLNLIAQAKAGGYLSQILVSHDAGWYQAGEPNGAMEKFGGFTLIFEKLIPALLSSGLTQADIIQIFDTNPANAFTIRPRQVEVTR